MEIQTVRQKRLEFAKLVERLKNRVREGKDVREEWIDWIEG